jgi:hypothetical protein
MSAFPDQAILVQTEVLYEQGRWVVYLEVTFWETDQRTELSKESEPLETVRHRIAEFSTRDRAEVAARWYERGADRNLFAPPAGF